MDYQATARKFRPQTFAELVGQESIARTLCNALSSGQVAQGFLFSGPRGVGKTSAARLLAKGLNCLAPEEGEPCNRCESCLQVTDGRFVDVIEIDGASNTGVDNIRELREQVQYMPAVGRYKVYIIDEVHMLSKGAFNALLKTLEEPPPHVTFIFATTELHKVPATIISRCQRYQFQRIGTGDLVAQLTKVAQAYDLEVEAEALWEIAVAADGSMRDAQSLFDQSVAFGGVTLEAVQEILGLTDRTILLETVAAVAAKEGRRLLDLIDTLVRDGRTLDNFLQGLAEQFRHLMVLRVTGKAGELVPLTEAQCQALIEAGAELTDDQVERSLALLMESGRELKTSPIPRFTVEVGLLRLLRVEPVAAIEELLQRLDSGDERPVERPRGSKTPPPASDAVKGRPPTAEPPATDVTPPVSPPPPAPPAAARSAAPPTPPESERVEEVAGEPSTASWPQIVAAIHRRSVSLASVLEHGHLVRCDPQGVEIAFPVGSFFVDQVEDGRALVEEALRSSLGSSASLIVREGEVAGSQPSVVEERVALQEEAKRQLVEKNRRVVDAVETFQGSVVDVRLASERAGGSHV